MTERLDELEFWMAMALEEARLAASEGEVPVGAVAVLGGELVSRTHNRSIQLCDPTAHAEVMALREAGRKLSNYRLGGLHLYVTLEPCAMCAGSLVWARIARLVFGARDEKAGAVFSVAELLRPGRFNHNVDVVEGVLARSCRDVIREFFQSRRGKPDSAKELTQGGES